MKQNQLMLIVLAVLVFLWFKKSQPASSGSGSNSAPTSSSGSSAGSTTIRFQPYPTTSAPTSNAPSSGIAPIGRIMIDTVAPRTGTTLATAPTTSPLRTALSEKYAMLNTRERYSL